MEENELQNRELETPEWLKQTQERSWEPEILISGIALLALTQVPRLLDEVQVFLEERSLQLFLWGNLDDIGISLLKASSYWLITGLIIHLVLRSIWVSFIGLSYTFPEGIRVERLKMQPYFQKRIERLPSFEHAIERLEAICSTIYSIAFLLMMATISACLYLIFLILSLQLIYLAWPGIIELGPRIDQGISIFSAIVALPYLIDFLTLGWLKRVRWLWLVYRPIYLFMSAITLAPVYRGIYYGLVSNLNRYALFGGLACFIALTYIIGPHQRGNILDQTRMIHQTLGIGAFDGYYRDTGPQRYSIWAHIQSDKIEDGLIELFIVHKAALEESIRTKCPGLEEMQRNTSRQDSIDLHCMKAYYQIKIGEEVVELDSWHFKKMQQSGQNGLLAWLDVEYLPRGSYRLELWIEHPFYEGRPVASIPFFKLSPAEGARMSEVE
jgi:hypothetical protein